MPENATIVIIAPVRPEDVYDLVWQGVWEATFDLASFGVEVENLTSEDADVARQREILTALLEEDVGAIGILPAHTSALNDLIDQHERRGTPVITFHGDAARSRRSAFVGPDSARSGTLAGEVLTKLIGAQGRVLSFPGDQHRFQLAGRYEAFRAELSRSASRVQEAAYTAELDFNRELPPEFQRALESADGIYAGDECMIRIAAACEEFRIRRPFVGFSDSDLARELLRPGIVSAIISEGRYQQGYFAVQKAYEAILKKERRDSLENIRTPSLVAFAANAAELQESLSSAFEMLVRQRTEILCSYKARLEQANAELGNLAITDPLTGLLNRRQFEKSLEQEVERARRYGPVSLLAIDVNLFKMVNDTYGHQIGDQALKAVAEVLKFCCRDTDICARLGGDEFGMILLHADSQVAASVRNRITECMSEKRISVPAQPTLTVSLSIGIATLPGEADDAAALMGAADASMYRAKQASRSVRGPALLTR